MRRRPEIHARGPKRATALADQDALISACASSRKRSPRFSKSGNWSNEAQAGDSSTTGSGDRARAGLGRRLRNGVFERFAEGDREGVANRLGESLARLADQIAFDDPVEQRPQRLDAALFRAAAQNPENVLERQQRLLGGVGVGRLRIIDEQDLAAPANLLEPVRQPRKGGERPAPRARFRGQAAPSAATAAAAFWPLCAPRNEATPARSAMRVEFHPRAR